MLQKILNLAKQRGEVVVFDPETGEAFILQPLEDEMEDFIPDFSDFEADFEGNEDDEDDDLPFGGSDNWLPGQNEPASARLDSAKPAEPWPDGPWMSTSDVDDPFAPSRTTPAPANVPFSSEVAPWDLPADSAEISAEGTVFDTPSPRPSPLKGEGDTEALTDQGLIAKIDRDIERWKAEQDAQDRVQEGASARVQQEINPLDELTLTPVPGQESEAGDTEEKFYIEPVE